MDQIKQSESTRPRANPSCLRRCAGRLLLGTTMGAFMFVGFIINLLQLLLITSYKLSNNRRWKSVHQEIHGGLLYTLWAFPTFLLQYWSNITINLYIEDKKLIESARDRIFGLIIPNHTYELDYMICYALTNLFGKIGSSKSFAKDELKYIPVIGWGFWLSDHVFVKRNWKKDKARMPKMLDALLDYDNCLLGLFSEGTRWTPAKQELSVEFAKNLNIEPFKHHLLPRPRGFNYTVRYCWRAIINKKLRDEKEFRLFNLQYIMPGRPNFSNFAQGDKIIADVYCEEVELSAELREEVLNSRDEEDCPKLTQLLYDMFRRKDNLVDEYMANNGKFIVRSENGGVFHLNKRRKSIFLIWFLSCLITYPLLFYVITSTFLAKSVIFWTLLVCFLSASIWAIYKVTRESFANNSLLDRRSRSEQASLRNAITNNKRDSDRFTGDEKETDGVKKELTGSVSDTIKSSAGMKLDGSLPA